MDMIALLEWSPHLITGRPGWGGCGAEISHEFQDLLCAAIDPLFTVAGADAYKARRNAEMYLLDGGHFALEEHAETVASLIWDFLSRRILRD